MSVINKMLNDLDKRQAETASPEKVFIAPVNQGFSKKALMLTLVILLALNVVGWFFWQMYQENNALKESIVSSNEKKKIVVDKLTTPKQRVTAEEKSSQQRSSINEAKQPAEKPRLNNVNSDVENKEVLAQKPSGSNKGSLNSAGNNKSVATASQPSIEQPIKIEETNSLTVENNKEQETAKVEKIAKPRLTISRKQMSAAELISQKMNSAEQAMALNEMATAESLFEEVLMIDAKNDNARMQLAALWYGRQSYQPALNLLSQGIALNPKHSQFRLMKARIYLNQGDKQSAFNMLTDLPFVEDVEYQGLRATLAQQTGDFISAIKAYELLLTLEPTVGRWWLGLAIAFDSNSEFIKAKQAYQMALSQINLSDSSQQFARRRLVELGE